MTSLPKDLHIRPSLDELALHTAQFIHKLALHYVQTQGWFTIALSGGSTPKKLHAKLADAQLFPDFPWADTHFFFGDDRYVTPDHDQSNYRMAKETLFSHVPSLPEANIHRMPTEDPDPVSAAARYERTLRLFFKAKSCPQFDLILLGMGDDGHTASLFPGCSAIDEREKWVVSTWVEKLETNRVTFTYPLINNADHVLFLIAGADKAHRLADILGGKNPDRVPYPSEAIQPTHGTLHWFLDQAAASEIVPAPSA